MGKLIRQVFDEAICAKKIITRRALIGLRKQVVVPKVGVTGDGHRNESEDTPGSVGENAAFLRAGWSAVQSQAAGSSRGVVWLSPQGRHSCATRHPTAESGQRARDHRAAQRVSARGALAGAQADLVWGFSTVWDPAARAAAGVVARV